MTSLATHHVSFPPAITPPEQPLGFFGAMAKLLDNPIEAWPKAVYEERFWRPTTLNLPGWKYLYVLDPDAIGEVILDKQADYNKDGLPRRILRPMLGDAILTAEGAQWRWQRRAAAPAFRHDLLLAMTPHMTRAAESVVARWRAANGTSERNIAQDMTHATFSVILDTMLSGGEGLDIEKTSHEIGTYLETLGRPSIVDILGLPEWTRAVARPLGARASNRLRAMVGRVVKRRRAEGSSRSDLLDQLMRAVEPDSGRQMSDVDLRDNIITFIAAGHETTALALTWTLYTLSQDPVSEARVLEEIRRVAGDAPIGPEHIEGLMFTKQVIQESIRLFPPAAAMQRMAMRDTTIAGETVEAGTNILIPIYALHRHRKLWPQPDTFDPERFAPGADSHRHRFAYLPFGGGPRICIGMSFAIIEATAMLATFMRAARFEHVETHAIRPLVRITLRPQGGMPMRVTLR